MDNIIIAIYFVVLFLVVLKFDGYLYLNPIKNYYEEWKKLNWFGVGVFTLIINLLLLPYAILYWVFKLFYWLFTVGRK